MCVYNHAVAYVLEGFHYINYVIVSRIHDFIKILRKLECGSCEEPCLAARYNILIL